MDGWTDGMGWVAFFDHLRVEMLATQHRLACLLAHDHLAFSRLGNIILFFFPLFVFSLLLLYWEGTSKQPGDLGRAWSGLAVRARNFQGLAMYVQKHGSGGFLAT